MRLKLDNQKFKIGDIVRSKKNYGLFGCISQVCKNEVIVEQNGFLIKLDKKNVEIVQNRAFEISKFIDKNSSKIDKKLSHNKGGNRSQKTIATVECRIFIKIHNTNTFGDELDLHGYKKEDALEALDRFVDKAQALGYTHVKIIHGKGLGILRTEVRSVLMKDPRIKKILVNNILFKGGSGVTWVELI